MREKKKKKKKKNGTAGSGAGRHGEIGGKPTTGASWTRLSLLLNKPGPLTTPWRAFHNPYGDGQASSRIAELIHSFLTRENLKNRA